MMQLKEVFDNFEYLRYQIRETPRSTWEKFHDIATPTPELLKIFVNVVTVLYGDECRGGWLHVRPYLVRPEFAPKLVSFEPEGINEELKNQLILRLKKIDVEQVEQISHMGSILYRWLEIISRYNDILLLARRIENEKVNKQN